LFAVAHNQYVESAAVAGSEGGEGRREITRQSSSIWNWICGRRKEGIAGTLRYATALFRGGREERRAEAEAGGITLLSGRLG